MYNLNGGNNVDRNYKDNALGFIWNCSRVSKLFAPRGTTFYILGPRYLSALKPWLTVFTDPD